MKEEADPVLFEIFKNSMHSIADEMALTVVRTSYSGDLRDNMDFATAFVMKNALSWHKVSLSLAT